MLKIHHINCATFCPSGGKLIDGKGTLFSKAKMVCHCLLIESEQGLILVETGLGMEDIENNKRLSAGFKIFARPILEKAETAISQIRKLGFSPDDVRHIILTHLDPDHAGGISDFPKAKIHLYNDEYEAAMRRLTFSEKGRYNPMLWNHHPQWELYNSLGEPWFGFDCVRGLRGLPEELLLVPITGHTRGHCAVAVNTGEHWLLHAGDAYFYHGEMDSDMRRCTPFMEVFQTLMQVNGQQRKRNQNRLRQLLIDYPDKIKIFCSHDAFEMEKYS
jgi:glyoxylase-like metal-dependent hydrolase (beta-lactamase superfamily II)